MLFTKINYTIFEFNSQSYKLFFLALTCSLFFVVSPLFADTIILKNKKVHRGKVIAQSEKSIDFRTKEGQQLTFQKREVLKVVYKDLNEQETKKVIQEEEKKVQKTTVIEEPKEVIEEQVPTPQEEPKPITTTTPDQRTWFSIFWRSALIPGWGQFKAGRYYSSGFIFLVSLGALGNTVANTNKAQTAESNYKILSALTPVVISSASQGNPTDGIFTGTIYNQAIFSSYQNTINTTNNSITIFSLIYGIQLIHAVYVGRQWEEEEFSSSVKVFKGWNFDYKIENQKFLGQNTYFELNYTFRF